MRSAGWGSCGPPEPADEVGGVKPPLTLEAPGFSRGVAYIHALAGVSGFLPLVFFLFSDFLAGISQWLSLPVAVYSKIWKRISPLDLVKHFMRFVKAQCPVLSSPDQGFQL